MPVLDLFLAELPAKLDQLAVSIGRKIDQAFERILQLDAHAVQAEHRFQQLLFGAVHGVAGLLGTLAILPIRARPLNGVLGHAQLLFQIRAKCRQLGDLGDDRPDSGQLPIRLVDRVRAEPLHGSTILPWMDGRALLDRVSEARVARLATADAAGKPHIVPITFAVEGDTLYFAVDAKPKRTTDLKRLRNIAANPAVSVLVDHYEDDWTRLWWVRIDGAARIIEDVDEADRAIDLLVSRYPQYRLARPAGPAVAISMDRISEWSGA